LSERRNVLSEATGFFEIYFFWVGLSIRKTREPILVNLINFSFVGGYDIYRVGLHLLTAKIMRILVWELIILNSLSTRELSGAPIEFI
jgi:hypothetical protein